MRARRYAYLLARYAQKVKITRDSARKKLPNLFLVPFHDLNLIPYSKYKKNISKIFGIFLLEKILYEIDLWLCFSCIL